MNYTRQQLIDALCKEYEFLCHDDYDPDLDLNSEEYRLYVECLSDGDLIAETYTDETLTLDEYMEVYG